MQQNCPIVDYQYAMDRIKELELHIDKLVGEQSSINATHWNTLISLENEISSIQNKISNLGYKSYGTTGTMASENIRTSAANSDHR